VVDGCTTNIGVFKALPVSPAELTTLKDTFATTLAAKEQGGKMNTAAKNAARAALLAALREDALYVEIACKNDLATLLSSGFLASSTNRAQSVLGQVQIKNVVSEQTGTLKARVARLANVKSFEGRIKPVGAADFGPSISFASSRKLIFPGLTPGVTYTLQLCGIGGSTGRGDWSAPVNYMPR
jgi:hypothetical protein